MIITGKKFSKPEMSRVINGDVVLENKDTQPEKFRLDHLLVEQHPEYNRSTLQKFIKEGYVTVDGEIVKKPNAQFERTVKILLTVPAKTPAEKLISPTILYEDAHVKVIDKPSGLLSMSKGEFCPESTLEDFGLLVHRLDRDTSGVVILAKDEATQSMLRRQFQERKAHKVYYAIVQGHPKLDEAKIDLPIARNLIKPSTFMVDPNGRESITYYKVLKKSDRFSLLELRPVTGRTHQLRVHLKYLGTPIVGDRVYGDEQGTARLMLHAKELEITIPGENPADANLRKTFSAPVPPDFDQFFEA